METYGRIVLNRIGIIGDIHAESSILASTLAFLDSLSLDAILCVGDIVDGSENVDACCKLLQQHRVIAVRGNHDNWFLANDMRSLPEATLPGEISPESRDYIQSLPATVELRTQAGPLMLCHGIGKKDMGRVTPDDEGYALEVNDDLRALVYANYYRFMANGHTHYPMVRAFGRLTILNAGSLKYPQSPCFMTADFESGCIQFYAFDELGGIKKMKRYYSQK